MNKLIILISAFLLISCGKSNTDYEDNIKSSFGDLLTAGSSKEKLINYLEINKHKFTETSLEKCLELKNTWSEAPCKNGPYIYSRINIKKLVNPIESGAHVYFYFDKNNKLESYDIDIKHTFL